MVCFNMNFAMHVFEVTKMILMVNVDFGRSRGQTAKKSDKNNQRIRAKCHAHLQALTKF